MQTSVQVLGTIQVARGSDIVSPSPRLARVLLGCLALRANTWVSTAWLTDALWPDDPPRSAASNLRNYLTVLRRLLPAGSVGLETERTRCRLTAAPAGVDSLHFQSLLDRGNELVAVGRLSDGVDHLTRAIALWRGPVFDGLIVPEAVQPEVHALRIRRQDAIENNVEARLALGQHHELIAELTRLVRRWPLRERLSGQLMLALYRSGRQVEALRTYDALRRRIDDELGVAPFIGIQQLHRRMLLADPQLASGGGLG